MYVPSISYLIKKGCSFFFNTFYGIKVKRSAPCLPILPHDFAVLGF